MNVAKKVILIVSLGYSALCTYFIIDSYQSSLHCAEENTLQGLEGIVNSLSFQINAKEHEYLVHSFGKDGIKDSEQDATYRKLHWLLKKTKNINLLNEEIYTMALDAKGDFFFVVTSADRPYFKHSYTTYPKILKRRFYYGGKINVYKDAHGEWLSAFAPIKNSTGAVVALVQCDRRFDEFITNARKSVVKNIVISLLVFAAALLILVNLLKKILLKEAKNKKLIEQKNKDILDSINYAKRLQNAILPEQRFLDITLPEHFIIYQPKDIVSGDFYWVSEYDTKIVVAAIDCTGHGVPGALLSMVGHNALSKTVNDLAIIRPDAILNSMNELVKKMLHQNKSNEIRDGMDMAVCTFDKKTFVLEYAGAGNPLYLVCNGVLRKINASRFSIGYAEENISLYVNHTIQLKKGDHFYIFSDGFADQFGGDNNKKFKTSRLRELLVSVSEKSMSEQKEIITNAFIKWKGNQEQVDDVLVIGISV
jgi:serine phosphatase RsbU (regulator of sigma subunit)